MSERGKGLCPLSEHWQMSDPRAVGLSWILCCCDQAFVPETAEAALLLPTALLGAGRANIVPSPRASTSRPAEAAETTFSFL